MKISAVAVLAILMLSSCGGGEIIGQPDWIHVSDTLDESAVYVDRVSLRGSHRARTAWVMLRAQSGNETRSQYVFDCGTASMSDSLDKFVKGKVSGVDPGSVDALVFNYACFDVAAEGYGVSIRNEPPFVAKPLDATMYPANGSDEQVTMETVQGEDKLILNESDSAKGARLLDELYSNSNAPVIPSN
jgi:hypothetical protein